MATDRGDLREGELIGGIEIEARIGSGGFGVVYRGRDPRGLRVALKVLTPDVQDDPEIGARLMKEATLMAEIEADNVVRFHAAGKDGGRIWLAMEYVPGGTLRDKLPRGRPIEVEQALRWARQIAEGTAELHKVRDAAGKSVVHRDLKPENVLLTRDGVAKVADFGIAKFRTSLKSTTSNDAIGTPLYMAPEQMGGSAAIDTRADVFALGVILYEMLSGSRPGEAGHAGELTLMEKLTRSLTQPVTPLPELNPDVPDYVWVLVERALQKAPEGRPGMRELADELVTALKRLRKERGRRPSFADGALPEPALSTATGPGAAASTPRTTLAHALTDPAPQLGQRGAPVLAEPEAPAPGENLSLAASSRSLRRAPAGLRVPRAVLAGTIAVGVGLGLLVFRLWTSPGGAAVAPPEDTDAGAQAAAHPVAPDAGSDAAPDAAEDAAPDAAEDASARPAAAAASPGRSVAPVQDAPPSSRPAARPAGKPAPPAAPKECVGVVCKPDF